MPGRIKTGKYVITGEISDRIADAIRVLPCATSAQIAEKAGVTVEQVTAYKAAVKKRCAQAAAVDANFHINQPTVNEKLPSRGELVEKCKALQEERDILKRAWERAKAHGGDVETEIEEMKREVLRLKLLIADMMIKGWTEGEA